MGTKYKAVIQGSGIYKEIEIPEEADKLSIGNIRGCDVRFAAGLFFGEIRVILESDKDRWFISCDGGLYITADGVLKQSSRQLCHGDVVTVKYRSTAQEVFRLSFMMDFESETKKYDWKISITDKPVIRIGSAMSDDITLSDPLIGEGRVVFRKEGSGYTIEDVDTRYGVYVNGIRIKGCAAVGDYDFFSITRYSFFVKGGALYTDCGKDMLLNGLFAEEIKEQDGRLKYPLYCRSTRVQYGIPRQDIKIQYPEKKPELKRRNLIMSLVPSFAMIVLIVLIRGIMGGGGTFVIFSVCSMSLGIVTSIMSWFQDRKSTAGKIRVRTERYLDYLEEKEEEIKKLRDLELCSREMIQESTSAALEELKGFTKRLFEKSGGDSDFLRVYLGKGDVEAFCRTECEIPQMLDPEDELASLPGRLTEKYRYLHDAPVYVDLEACDSVGIVGAKDLLDDLVKNLTLDLALRTFYEEVKLFFIFSDEDTERFSWVCRLKNVRNDELAVRNIVCDGESRNIVLEYLYNEISRREGAVKETGDEGEKAAFDRRFVIFVLDKRLIEKHPLSKYFENASGYGVTFIFCEEYEELLPRGCTNIIRLWNAAAGGGDDGSLPSGPGTGRGNILVTRNAHLNQDFRMPDISFKTAAEAALRLGAIYVDEAGPGSELTKNITFFEMMKINSADEIDLSARWDSSKVYRSMAAPLGVRRGDEYVYLDISDKSKGHGPHGLVAGTTGSGKSEILQTYVLSMATLFHPYDVGFMFIDFKGGGMANQFRDLPHLMGTITNIDGREINRSLLSIKAELVYRQEVFSRNGVNHIDDYIKLYKKGKAARPMPHLIIIVDEFAELKAEYPDFMKEIISAARIGRTLGVHLILATQKPSGVVDNQIWSNSKFRLCLKVQTKEDSREVIKSPLAAEITEPGRAYFQVGNNEVFEIFQSAYSGAEVPTGEDNSRTYSIYSVNFWGRRACVYSSKKKKESAGGKTQLEAVVDYVHEYAENKGIEKLPGICLPPLESKLSVSSLGTPATAFNQGVKIPVGYYDDPGMRRQADMCIDLTAGNTYCIGSAQSGKTTLLQTLIYQLIRFYTPSEVNIYIADCGNMALKVFENAAHVGGVALCTQEERMNNLLRMLTGMAASRKDEFSKRGIGTFKAYLEAGFTGLSQVVLIIDNVTVFRDNFPGLEDALMSLSRDGPGVGISLAVSGVQTGSIGYRALSNYSQRIALHCNEKAEYGSLFDRCRIEPPEIPGRGLCVIDKRVLEFQTALAFDADREIDRTGSMQAFLAGNSRKYAGIHAKPIPEVPEVIDFRKLRREEKELFTPYCMPFGLDYADVEYRPMQLAGLGALAISGREKSGRTNFIKYIFAALKADVAGSYTQAFIVDDRRMRLMALDSLGFVNEYGVGRDALIYAVDGICRRLEEREAVLSEARGAESENVFKELPLILLVVNDAGAPSYIAADKKLQGKVNTILRRAKNLKTAVIFSSLDNAQVGFQSLETLKMLKDNKKFLVFEDMENIRICETNTKLVREFSKPLSAGDAYLFLGNRVHKIKTPFAGDVV